jgi:hypothetical protein
MGGEGSRRSIPPPPPPATLLSAMSWGRIRAADRSYTVHKLLYHLPRNNAGITARNYISLKHECRYCVFAVITWLLFLFLFSMVNNKMYKVRHLPQKYPSQETQIFQFWCPSRHSFYLFCNFLSTVLIQYSSLVTG